MLQCIGIRRETKDKTQSRTPLSPDQVRRLVSDHGIRVVVEPWERRVFADEEYRVAGAEVSDHQESCNIIFGVKEIAPEYLAHGQTYCFFSHTVKGQSYNMMMLQTIMDRGITLLDYEMVTDEQGRRLIYFGDYAGYAGMIDGLWALGRRLDHEGMSNPFSHIRYATEYTGLSEIREALGVSAAQIRQDGLDPRLVPFVCGFTGYGHVSKSAQSLFDLLPVETIAASDLESFMQRGRFSNKCVYKVVFSKPDLYEPVKRGDTFDANSFRNEPSAFKCVFERYVPHLTMIVNGIYWEPRFPRLLTKSFMRRWFPSAQNPRLRIIADITCDVDGSIELTVKETNADNPVFVYEPASETIRDGWEGAGPVILAVDKLPTELPLEASQAFGDFLLPWVPTLANIDFTQPLDQLHLPESWGRALIIHNGILAPRYKHLQEFIDKENLR